MGNKNSRADSEGTDLLIHRCPGRNRSLGNLISKDTNPKYISSKRDINFKMISLNQHEINMEKQNQSFRTENEVNKEFKEAKSRSHGIKRKRQRFFEVEPNSSESENLTNTKKLKHRRRKIGKPKQIKEKQENYQLIEKIFETLAVLEATFMEEKKFERHLFTAVDTQIQEIQRFSLLLEKERTQNKKLLALLDCSNDADEENFNEKVQIAERTGQTFSERKIYSRNMSASLSPLALQQKCDELAANLNRCRSELSNKHKECNLLHYKLEELQGNCATLTQELQDSSERIELMNRDIAALKLEKKSLKRTLKTFTQAENDIVYISDMSCRKNPHELLQQHNDELGKRVCCVKAKAE